MLYYIYDIYLYITNQQGSTAHCSVFWFWSLLEILGMHGGIIVHDGNDLSDFEGAMEMPTLQEVMAGLN